MQVLEAEHSDPSSALSCAAHGRFSHHSKEGKRELADHHGCRPIPLEEASRRSPVRNRDDCDAPRLEPTSRSDGYGTPGASGPPILLTEQVPHAHFFSRNVSPLGKPKAVPFAILATAFSHQIASEARTAMGRLPGEQKQLRDSIERPEGTLARIPAHSVTANKFRGPVVHMQRDSGGHRINLLPTYRAYGNQQTLQDFPAFLGDPEHTGRPHST